MKFANGENGVEIKGKREIFEKGEKNSRKI